MIKETHILSRHTESPKAITPIEYLIYVSENNGKPKLMYKAVFTVAETKRILEIGNWKKIPEQGFRGGHQMIKVLQVIDED